MKNKELNLDANTKKKSYLHNSKYILICVILIIISLLISNIYNISNSIEIGRVNSNEYEFLAPSTITAQGKVVIKYQDTQGNKLAEDAVLVGNVGDVYETQRKDIASYVQYGNDPINKIGNFDSNDTEVIYVYERENNGVNVLNQDNVITVQVVKGQNNKYDEIGFSIVTKSTTGDIIKGAKYMVTDKNSSVIKNSTSYGDKLIIGKLTISEEGTDSYSIKELSAPSGYNGISDTIKLDVNKKLNTQTNKYEVTISAQDYKNVEISMENGEIIVVVLNEKNSKPVDPVNPKEPEDPEEPEKTEEPVKEKKFDLQIEKYIKEVKIITDDEVITKTKDRNDKEIMKIDIPKNKIEKTKLQITYGIEVRNVGELGGYATEIVDAIPEGMEIEPSSTWVVTDNQAKTDNLADILLKPGENATMFITCNWNLTNGNVGLKTNKAVITKYHNDRNVKDESELDYSEESLLVATKTGEIWPWAPQALGILILLACVVVIMKKF